MLKQRQDGFTLVEITIVLAITASLATIVLSSQNATRVTAQFRGVVTTLASSLNEIRTNAAASIADGGTGTNTSRVIFGELVQARPGDSYLTVSDLLATNNLADNSLSGSLASINARQISLPFGVTIRTISSPSIIPDVTIPGDTYSFVYHRLFSSGKLVLYAVGRADYHPVIDYTESPAGTLAVNMFPIEAIKISVTDGAGRSGSVTVDGLHDAATTTQVIAQ
jgi:prepilin-type N-terminal cleavage/methylation domain-containing protein